MAPRARPTMLHRRPARRRFMLLLVAAVASAVGRPSPASGDCVSALRYPNEPAFDVCRTGETVCWLYLSEKPFIAVDPLVNASVDAARRRPHRCADHSAYGVAGSSFSILKVVSLTDRMTAAPEPDHMCVFAGKPDECSFNATGGLGCTTDVGALVAAMGRGCCRSLGSLTSLGAGTAGELTPAWPKVPSPQRADA